jgi:hypothetical protein
MSTREILQREHLPYAADGLLTTLNNMNCSIGLKSRSRCSVSRHQHAVDRRYDLLGQPAHRDRRASGGGRFSGAGGDGFVGSYLLAVSLNEYIDPRIV